MNSIEPPGSADISHMATRRCGRLGQPGDDGSHGWCAGLSKFLASGIRINLGEFGAQ